jgi:site-specific recombinase XerC
VISLQDHEELPCPLRRRWIRLVAAARRPPCPGIAPAAALRAGVAATHLIRRAEEIIQVMRCCGDGLHGDRARGLIVVLWRAGLRLQEALDLTELDLDARRGSVLVRRGKGGRRREVGTERLGL